MSHTPGPWRVNYGNAVGGGNYLNVTTVPHAPATPARVKFFEIPIGNRATMEDLANARLIATAPDLLAALEDLLDQLDSIGIPDWHGAEGLCLEQSMSAIKKAKSAIKKARVG